MTRAAAALIACVALLPACGSRHTPPRNLLVITLDTMRADRLPAYGAGDLLTPALSRLAAEGAVFDQAFASVPLTLPSHASLFTGLQPPRLGVRDNAGAPVPQSALTLAEMLEARGMKTGAVLASGVLAPGRGLEQGFADYGLAKPGNCSPAHARRSAEDVVSHGRATRQPTVCWPRSRSPASSGLDAPPSIRSRGLTSLPHQSSIDLHARLMPRCRAHCAALAAILRAEPASRAVGEGSLHRRPARRSAGDAARCRATRSASDRVT